MQKIDTDLAQECVDLVGEENKVPVSPLICDNYPIQGAMDNFVFGKFRILKLHYYCITKVIHHAKWNPLCKTKVFYNL